MIYLAGAGVKGFGLPGKTSNIKIILNGGQYVTFLRPDGYFSLYPTILLTLLNIFKYLICDTSGIFGYTL